MKIIWQLMHIQRKEQKAHSHIFLNILTSCLPQICHYSHLGEGEDGAEGPLHRPGLQWRWHKGSDLWPGSPRLEIVLRTIHLFQHRFFDSFFTWEISRTVFFYPCQWWLMTVYPLRVVPSQIKDLTDHHLPGKRHLVTCVAEGVPTPTIQWYSCDSMLK